MAVLAPGMKLGPYDIVAPLGAGGMGEVYRARDPRLGRDVALKVLPEAVAAHPDRLLRFEREAKTVAALNHPNIVTIFSIEEAGSVRFLTMELVEGDTLDRRITPGGLPLDRALDIAIPLADALAAAHARGIVHRDLKPGNVMVTRDGRVKVLDFGLAKQEAIAGRVVSDSSLDGTQGLTVESPASAAGMVVGTVPYMAPEQVRGNAVDARADLFSLGIILYELVTGKRPFAGRSFADVSSAILRDAPPPIQLVRAGLPRDLDRIIGRCLEKDLERRFQTAKDVRNELEIVRRDLSADASSPGQRAASSPAAAAPSPPTRDVPSIAVMPFANRSRDPDDEYFSDGLADELLNVLAKIRGLRVAARTSSATFKGKEVTIADIGRALNVETVLEGSVRKSGNRVRIAVQLVKVSDGYPLWSETYDRTLDDIFVVQDDIAQSVVKELRTALLGEAPDSKTSGEVRAEVAAAAKGRGGNTEAHRLYMQGHHLIDRVNQADVAKGIEYLRSALELDPRHALAWVELARAYYYQAGYDWADVAEGYTRSREAAARAIEIEPELAEGYAALGHVQVAFDWDWADAEASFRRALELAPGSADVLRGAAAMALILGRNQQALDLARRAVAQDPLSASGYLALGRTCYETDEFAAALEAEYKALELAPQRIAIHFWIAILMSEMGRHDEAIAEAKLEPAIWARDCALGVVCHAAGRSSEADEALRNLVEQSGHTAAFQIAAVHAFRGAADETFVWLERSYQQRDPGLAYVSCTRVFRPIHGDPRWGAFMKQMGFAS